ncbi:indole-3-glycerol phosphate synthase TrpC [Coxiella burnetii]|uniref:indole-3-glycerol-phosphate synthase n=2 Tax=Coxiella burnetii TaxID=777 RepID=Q83CG4_COXBU|nr:indole-3-glycerol phosphate synthase TrpC [Coxiella burnetii]NP_820151.1 indole-3-glycerol phosphate synthase [Coxiella burnetii RSA 493]AAO90665.1 indole-3-glycerol phosphate synthase [Coxiella burnetii RSA 493]ARI65959.1 indole-3-glycerol phosphate synthase [Coxiella burnetii]ARK27422.1 indole-3-glycerol phosphate synthase [Coxiella burnetii]ATN74580.1 indole-3-glycerol phosphate synthase [Coxiella burnetii]ATN76484.1 indole-3-glycerol phosphate synthase [Coxiella burnetii]
MHDYLKAILKNKKQEIAHLKANFSSDAFSLSTKKSFKRIISSTPTTIIAEIKRRSPSKGHLAEIADPVALAKQYVQGGAAGVSVLTDKLAFDGSIRDLQQVSLELRDRPVAVLRKDFILDPLQIEEAAVAGADAILLIVAILKDATKILLQKAHECGLEALVEVHNRQELDQAIEIGAEIIGVNNRNLTTFSVDPNNALKLKPYIPDHIISVAESGIHTVSDAKRYISAGYNAVLVGEALVKSENPQQFISAIKEND